LLLVDAELKDAVTPPGIPPRERLTLLYRLTGLTMLIVLLPALPPVASVRLAAEGDRLKLGS